MTESSNRILAQLSHGCGRASGLFVLQQLELCKIGVLRVGDVRRHPLRPHSGRFTLDPPVALFLEL